MLSGIVRVPIDQLFAMIFLYKKLRLLRPNTTLTNIRGSNSGASSCGIELPKIEFC